MTTAYYLAVVITPTTAGAWFCYLVCFGLDAFGAALERAGADPYDLEAMS